MKLMIVAGGGGHFAPALALIESLPKDVEVLVIGRKYAFEADKTESLEFRTAKKLGIPFIPLTTGRLQRKFSKQSIQSLLKVPIGYVQALQILKKFQPDVVVSFGGYVSLPVAFAAKTLGLPIVVHEQILGAGLANKIVAKFAEKVCVSWEESAKFFPREKVVVTGNPMKKWQMVNGKWQIANENEPVIYITGGSGGAHGINVLVEDCLERLLKKYFVIHQTGDAKEYGDFDRLAKKKDVLPEQLKKRYVVTKFVEPGEVFGLLQQADLVVSRSGINTVTELLSLGKPCLLIPLPHGQRKEQETNALFVKKTGIAEVVEQQQLTGDELATVIEGMIINLSSYMKHSAGAKKEVITEGVANLFKVIEDVNKQTKTTRS